MVDKSVSGTSGYLTPFVTDTLAVLGAMSAVLTLMGFLIAVWQLKAARDQLKKQTDAFTAAQDASLRVANGAKRQYLRHVHIGARRTFGYLRQHVHDEQWELAYRRAGDLAEEVAQLADERNDPELAALLERLRGWDSELRRQEPARPLGPKRIRSDWFAFTEAMAAALDQGIKPLDGLAGDETTVATETQ